MEVKVAAMVWTNTSEKSGLVKGQMQGGRFAKVEGERELGEKAAWRKKSTTKGIKEEYFEWKVKGGRRVQ